jgi:hypothetical protein
MQSGGQADPSELKIRVDGFVNENVVSIKWSVSVVGLPYAPYNGGRMVTYNFDFQSGISEIRAIHCIS